jgi:Spy/CpxP family protein refolding chaperone
MKKGRTQGSPLWAGSATLAEAWATAMTAATTTAMTTAMAATTARWHEHPAPAQGQGQNDRNQQGDSTKHLQVLKNDKSQVPIAPAL